MCWASVGECGGWPDSRISRVGGLAMELRSQTHGCYRVVGVCGWGGGGLGDYVRRTGYDHVSWRGISLHAYRVNWAVWE